MNDLRIGKRSMNALALEKQQQTCHQVPRNASVFQFPDTTNTGNAAFKPKKNENVEPTYAKVVKPVKKSEKLPVNVTNEQKSRYLQVEMIEILFLITGYLRSNWTKLNSYFRQETIHVDQKHYLYIFSRSWHLCFYL